MAKTDKVLVPGTWGIQWSFKSLIILFIGALILTAVNLTGEKKLMPEDEKTSENSLQGCNLFSGKWVFDNKSYPLYKGQQCSFMLDEFACEKFGKKDLNYQHWRWQPHDCDLPRFNATALLEKLRGKRLVFVGDSLNRNQWVSLVCLVESSIPPELKSRHWNGSLFTFKATGYNASIDFYWAPFLVESNCDDPFHHHLLDRRVRVQAIEKHARHWTDADFLIFGSFIWWLEPTTKVLWESSEQPNGIWQEVELLSRYEMGLNTWADWLETNVNHTKSKLFFVSMSSAHFRGEDWGKDANTNCYNETEQVFEEGYRGTIIDPKMMGVVDATLGKLEIKGVKVQFLNITQMTEYRKDGHPSIYRKYWAPLTTEQLSNPPSYSDCGHWCLPGVPDTWNELLYAYIFYY